MFVGQSGGKAKGGGMPQREQKAVLAAFRKGEFNTLVATCIGEEGLDIPQARTTAGFYLDPDSVLPIPFPICKLACYRSLLVRIFSAWCVARCV